jgi:imidazolonepropionase-like amidohydrolase
MRRRYAAALSLALIAVVAGARGADSPPSKSVVYLGATLIDGTGTAARRNVAIVTRDDRIVAVRSADGFHPDGAEIVDIRSKYVIPGLINSHVHLATLANPPVAQAYLRRELYSGVTTVRDMAGDVRLLGELKREADLNEIVSPDIYYVAVMSGPGFFVDPRTHDSSRGQIAGQVPWMQAITANTDLKLAMAQARGTGATAIKLYADLPGPLLSKITAEAHRQHLLVWAHAAVFPATPSEVVNAGVDVISHACLLGYEISEPPVLSFETMRPVDSAKLRQPNARIAALLENIKQRGTILDATLFTFQDSSSRNCPLDINDYLAREAYRAGIAISAGTDDDPDWKDVESNLDKELELLVAKVGMTPAEALRSASFVGARATGVEKDVGTIESGKIANMVILDRNPIENITNVRSVYMTVKRGIPYLRSAYKPARAEDFK